MRRRTSTSRSAGRSAFASSDFRGKRNVLLVFHPFAWTAVCEEEALDLQANLPSFESADTEVILVSCDSAPSRQAWREKLQLGYTLASDFWPHGVATKAYGVFNEERGAPVRGTFLIDKTGVVVWTLVNGPDNAPRTSSSPGRWLPRPT